MYTVDEILLGLMKATDQEGRADGWYFSGFGPVAGAQLLGLLDKGFIESMGDRFVTSDKGQIKLQKAGLLPLGQYSHVYCDVDTIVQVAR